MTNFTNSLEFAKQLDSQDSLRSYRSKFHIPQHEGHDMVYFTGNSLRSATKNY
jgi:kynureninase